LKDNGVGHSNNQSRFGGIFVYDCIIAGRNIKGAHIMQNVFVVVTKTGFIVGVFETRMNAEYFAKNHEKETAQETRVSEEPIILAKAF
jgi:hypothetical protein